MSDDRTRILNMLAEGKITADEAARLLDALGSAPGGERGAASALKETPRFMCVQIRDEEDRVDVRLPLALIRAGMKIKNLLPEHASDQIQAKMNAHGVRFDLDDLNDKNIDDLIEALTQMSVDVSAAGGTEKVRVFCE